MAMVTPKAALWAGLRAQSVGAEQFVIRPNGHQTDTDKGN